MVSEAPFRIRLASSSDRQSRDLVNGVHFRLNEDRIPQTWLGHLPPLLRDLTRIGTAIYVADRLVRRPRRQRGTGRQIDLRVDVRSPAFWTTHTNQIIRSLSVLSNDVWRLQFSTGTTEPVQPGLFADSDSPPLVCLYSGGLDSAGGLLTRLRDGVRSVVTVTACHQPGQRRRVLQQLDAFRKRYRAQIIPIMVRTTLRRAPLHRHQESSQRCRSFLFHAIGGAVAATVGARRVEVYESGVGVLNLPMMTGMLVAGRATRSCHPAFTRLMTELVTAAADRPIQYAQPFVHRTKSEVVRIFADTSLQRLVPLTTSCVHYPLRNRGSAKHCGVCFACIGRRQALFAAGVDDPVSQYNHDIFDTQFNPASTDLDILHAHLFYIARLAELASPELPTWFSRHLYGSHVAGPQEPVAPWCELMLRYRNEWLRCISYGKQQRLKWAYLVDAQPAA